MPSFCSVFKSEMHDLVKAVILWCAAACGAQAPSNLNRRQQVNAVILRRAATFAAQAPSNLNRRT